MPSTPYSRHQAVGVEEIRMPDVRYVCLSDLHFGAENSILTELVDGGVDVDPHRRSPVMEGLVECLAELIGRNEERVRPTLILCGDILELALADDNVAAMVFERFVELVFPSHGEPLFASTVYFMPGNHDHHIWEGARERQYAAYVRARPRDEDLEIPWHTTHMLTEKDHQPVDSELLTALIHRATGAAHVTVRVVYPNLALGSADGTRSVAFHHGHYLESIYRLMTTFKDAVFPTRPHPETIWEIEAENFAWIDFFWSTMGRSGEAGVDIGLIYASFQSDVAMDRIADNITRSLGPHLPGPSPVQWLEGRVLRPILRRVTRRIGQLERSQPDVPLTDSGRRELLAYLDGPLRCQYLAERPTAPTDLTFVFGHTHKPFQTRVPTHAYSGGVDVYNSGGWVVDTLETVPLQGGAAILVSEALDTASLRFYNQSQDASTYRVELGHANPDAVDSNPFLRRLQDIVDAGQPPWSTFSAAAADMVARRHQDLAVMLRLRDEQQRGRPRA
jgi:UDP-2,3-diacylglucosamine pyrophosphatase LpxH